MEKATMRQGHYGLLTEALEQIEDEVTRCNRSIYGTRPGAVPPESVRRMARAKRDDLARQENILQRLLGRMPR